MNYNFLGKEVDMKRMLFLIVALGAVVATFSSSQRNVLLMPREGAYLDLDLMLSKEVRVMMTMLEAEGYKVTVASLSGKPFIGKNITINTDYKLSEVKINDYCGIVIPCMAVGLPGSIPREAVDLVKQASSLGIPIAAQFGSVCILGEAGLLKGKKYALAYHRFPEGVYSGTGVVADGNIITSGTCPAQAQQSGRPDGTAELINTFIRALGAIAPKD